MCHGFHKTNIGVRFTISEPARQAVLQRLLKLNHERHEEHVREGLHEKEDKARKTPKGQGRPRQKRASPGQQSFFENDDEDGPALAKPRATKPQTASEEDHGPLPIEEYETDDVMATFRQAARGRGWLEREELMREVAQLWGYQRLSTRVRDILKGHMMAAIRRGIIETNGDCVRPLTNSMADYTLDGLRETLCSVMRKNQNYDREDVAQAVASYLGFQRVTDTVRDSVKSAINSAIRQGILGYEGTTIWRQ